MTDFTTQIRHQGTDFIVRSLLDIDFYKLTMCQFIWKNYRGTEVTFKLINRDKHIPLARIIPEHKLREQLDHVRTLRMRKTDLYYLRGMDLYGKNMFSDEYLEFLSNVHLGDYDLRKTPDGEQYILTFKGPWEIVTFWETIALAIISELFYRELLSHMNDTEISVIYANATKKLYDKLVAIKKFAPKAKVADFGQRRRHSFLWQQQAIKMAKEILGDQFVGTSNTYFAFNQDLVPIGTNAHELVCTIVALEKDDSKKVQAQYKVLTQWEEMYGEGLRVMLPDTYGSEQFFRNMPEEFAKKIATTWKGQRQDSGDPATEARNYMAWLSKFGVDPKGKVNIFSDGLDTGSIVSLTEQFSGEIITPFGWGTKLTNDFEGCIPNGDRVVPNMGVTYDMLFRPFSMVVKVYEVDGEPAVKLSNNYNKATGTPEAIARYIKIFGEGGMSTQKTEV
jgi:nicotinate phosphoribosyltransferase